MSSRVSPSAKSPAENRSQPVTLELGRQLFRDESAVFAQKRGCDDLGLIVERRDKAEKLAVELHAFAHGIDIGVRGLHLRGNLDATPHGEARIIGQPCFRADAHGHDHQIGRQGFAAVEQNRFGLVLAQNGLGRGLGLDGNAAPLQILAQQIARGFVELPLHQVDHQVQHGHIHAALGEAGGRFQTQQTAADHHGAAALGGGLDHRVGVIEIAVGDHPGQVLAGHRNDEGR